MAKDYFQSEEFNDLLTTYEQQKSEGKSVYLDADDFADIGDYYLYVDQPVMAVEAINMGLSIHPDDEVLLSVLSSAYIYQHEYEKAEKLLDTLDPQNTDVQYQRAQLKYAHEGDTAQAERMWRMWLKEDEKLNPSEDQHREAYIHVISSMIELRNADLGDEECDWNAVRRWIREYIDVFQPLGQYDEDLQMADICRENELADLLCDVLTQVLEEKPYLPQGWSSLALAQYVEKRYEQALESCDFALAIDPEDMDTLLTKAHTYQAMGERVAAEPLFKEYLDRGGEKVQIIPYAEILFQTGRKAAALAELNTLVEHSWTKLMAAMELSKREKDEFYQEYDEALDFFIRVMSDVGELMHQNGCYEESNAVYSRIVKVLRSHAESHFMMGVNYLAVKKYEAASHSFGEALKWADDQVTMGVDIALTFVINNFDQCAVEVLNAVSQIATDSDSPSVRTIPAAKSLSYLKLGRTDQFLENFRIACAETPDLVKNIFEEYFPQELPISQWGDYAEKNIDTLFSQTIQENPSQENRYMEKF